MNFFRHQEEARRATTRLLVLFTLAVTAVVLAINLFFIALVALAVRQSDASVWSLYTGEHWLVVSGTTVAVIAICSFFRQLSLRDGRSVADALGAQRLDPGTRDFDEKQVLNVVEEMAIASGMPVPDVYLMNDSGINAFAAGYQPSDAIIGITRGAIQALNREQLQGVIAHEFSHIFNGDMRMNMRLTGTLYGIVFIGEMGRMVLRGTHNSRRAGGVVLLGLGLMTIGYVGEFFGRLIKSAVSRQREFLADASAVQFTRNVTGISDALRVIGHGSGTRVASPAALEVAHFFFGPVARFKRAVLATHPPIDERILRLIPGWDGHYLAPRPPKVNAPKDSVEPIPFTSALNGDGSDQLSEQVSELASSQSAEATLESALNNAMSAQSLVLALLMMNSGEDTARRQQDLVSIHLGQPVFLESLRLLNVARTRAEDEHLELLERAMPALRHLSLAQYREFHKTLVAAIKMNGQVSLYEWCLYRLVLQYLGSHFGTLKPVTPHRKSAHALADDIATLLAYVARAGHADAHEAERAYEAALAKGQFLTRPMLPEWNPEQSLKPMNLALTAISGSPPAVRERVVNALFACISFDHQITATERSMLKAIAAVLETPVGMFEHTLG